MKNRNHPNLRYTTNQLTRSKTFTDKQYEEFTNREKYSDNYKPD